MSTEIIVSTALAFWILGAVKCLDTFNVRDVLLLSFLTTIILCINPAFIFIPVLCTIALFFLLPIKSAIRLSAAFLAPIVFFSLLWGVRNYAVTGTFNLFDSRGGKEFWVGNHQRTDGRWEGPGREVWFKELEQHGSVVSRQGGNVFDMNRYMYKQGIQEIVSNPPGAIVLFVKKFFRFWYVPASETMLTLTIPMQSFYLLLACAGLAWGSWRNRGMWLAVFIIAYYCGIYTLSYACIRFSHPIMPWVCALGGVGIVQGWNRYYGGELWRK